MPLTGTSSVDLRAYLRYTIDKNMPLYKHKVVFRSTCRVGNFGNMKDSLEKKIHSKLVLRYTCSNCKVIYYGKTLLSFFFKSIGIHWNFESNWRRFKDTKELAISDYLLQYDCPITFDNFDILTSNFNKFKLTNKGKFTYHEKFSIYLFYEYNQFSIFNS